MHGGSPLCDHDTVYETGAHSESVSGRGTDNVKLSHAMFRFHHQFCGLRAPNEAASTREQCTMAQSPASVLPPASPKFVIIFLFAPGSPSPSNSIGSTGVFFLESIHPRYLFWESRNPCRCPVNCTSGLAAGILEWHLMVTSTRVGVN